MATSLEKDTAAKRTPPPASGCPRTGKLLETQIRAFRARVTAFAESRHVLPVGQDRLSEGRRPAEDEFLGARRQDGIPHFQLITEGLQPLRVRLE